MRLQVWLCGSIHSFLLHVVLCEEACRHASPHKLKFRIWDKFKLTYKCEGYKNTAPRALKVADMWIPVWKGSVGKSQAMTWSVNTATPKRQTSFRVIGSHETVSQDLAPCCDTNQITRTKVLVRRSLSKLLPSNDKTHNLGKKRQQCYVWCSLTKISHHFYK
jgi:hypothetical protein